VQRLVSKSLGRTPENSSQAFLLLFYWALFQRGFLPG